ncbi:hypothetical protein V1525DRAFT_445068, partial [Lipomyces kononenkoae]
STTSRVEGSHGALKGALTSSSGTLLPAGKKINRRARDQSEQSSIIGSNQNLHVSLEIRNQVETATLCTAISRSALELVYAEVRKKLNHNDEDGTTDNCACTIGNRYLLPCSHQIQLGVPLDVAEIHPRWRVSQVLPPPNVVGHNIDPETLSTILKDPKASLPRKGRPTGTRRLQTSAENILNAADRRETVRRCGSCHEAGHNRRTCPRFLSQQLPQCLECEDIPAHSVQAEEDMTTKSR